LSQPKVFEFAKEVGMSPLALMDKIREWKLPVKSHMAELEPEMLEKIRAKLAGGESEAEAPAAAPKKKTAAKKTKAASGEAAPKKKVAKKAAPAAAPAPANAKAKTK
jgi:translation initiation factor IF-2